MTVALMLALGLAVTACGGSQKSQAPAATPTASPVPTPRPTATADASGFYPVGTRTGQRVVDTVIQAAERRDKVTLQDYLHYTPLPCAPGGQGGTVACTPEQPEGTQIEVVGVSLCQVRYLRKGVDNPDQVITMFLNATGVAPDLNPRVLAVIRRQLYPTGVQTPAQFVIVFGSAHAVAVDDKGITYLRIPCGREDPTMFITGGASIPGQTYLLAPRLPP